MLYFPEKENFKQKLSFYILFRETESTRVVQYVNDAKIKKIKIKLVSTTELVKVLNILIL